MRVTQHRPRPSGMKSLVIVFTAVCAVLSFDLEPGDDAPLYHLKTLNGFVDRREMTVFYALDNRSAFVECLWTKNESVDHLIQNSSSDVQYVFMSFSESAEGHVSWMQNRLKSRVEFLSNETGIRFDGFLKRAHFVIHSAGKTGTWIDWLLGNWTCRDHGCGINQLNITTAASGNFSMRRLDSRYDWIPEAVEFTNKTLTLSDFGDGCTTTSKNLMKKLALVYRGGPANCTYFTKIQNAQQSNASGVIVYSTPDLPLVDMNCQGDECDHQLQIPGTMISYVDGMTLKMALTQGDVNVTFTILSSPLFYFGVDAEGRVQQTGWLLYPSFLFLTWQAEWFQYTKELNRNLSKPADVVPVFERTVMQGIVGATTIIEVPPMKDLQQYSNIELDMALSCPGTRDSTCAQWDHIVSLYICCNMSGPYCGQELGRWITPFRRRIGHWLTPVRPLLPFFDAKRCNFTMKLDASWAMPWLPSLNIRFSNKQQDNSNITVPHRIQPLFRGGKFNKFYNSRYAPISFYVGLNDVHVKLESVITGHGSDNHNCAEFCVTSHHFVVNGKYEYVQTFSNAGTPLGCARRVLDGVEPNEHGTWLYGRDGWCDGQEVLPWVVDITECVHQGKNDVKYFGLFNGKDPDPDPKVVPGYIMMYSNVIFYRKMDDSSMQDVI
ncbi:uncharacterized protein LOC134186380 [Corticium candelabrum]|uniref:uncharacterized protein LOC134186380 n=1 Tax=Corticium candelabrum TaxID=121492 RepID=UPI002E258F83|nr:uncharacterized protein LOC134186380 [Corticium candelabrum]